MKKTLACLGLILLTSCATSPDRIKPIPTLEPCTTHDRARLQSLTEQQGKMARDDAIGVLLIGLPLGSLGKTKHNQEIAVLKGKCNG